MAALLLPVAAATALPARGQRPAGALPRGPQPDVPLAELLLSQWTKDEGLPTDTLVDVTTTSGGDLWAVGFGGLARFDGIGFETFNQRRVPELEASSFYKLLELPGRLLLASQGAGIWRFADNRFSRLSPDGRQDSVRALWRDRAGTLWAGLADGGAVRLEGDRLVPAGWPEIAGVTVRDILETDDGALWFATEGAGLGRLEGGRFTIFTTASGLVDDSVTSLAPAAGGGLWIGTQTGLGRYRDGELSRFPELAGIEVFAVAEDDHDSLWVAAEQGLFRRHGGSGRVEKLTEHGGRSLRSINGLAFDHEGGVWISSYTSGLFQLREASFVTLTRADGLASERVNSVYRRRDGSLLIGGDQGAILRLEDGALKRLELARPLPDVRVRGFLEDRDGTLWIASHAGLLRIAGGRQRLFTVADGMPTNQARFVHRDRRGRLWIGTRGGGLVRMTGDGAFVALGAADGLASDFVLALAEDPAGNLLVGTQGGLSVVGPQGGITSYGAADGLPADLIFNIHVDADGAAWLATTGGLARFAGGAIGAVTVRHGLPAEAVYDLLEDELGAVWLSSGEGVIRVEKRQLEAVLAGRRARLEPRLFDDADGMADRQCTGGARLMRGPGGDVWIPTLGGLSRVSPHRIPVNPVPPPVHIHRVRVDGEPLAGSDAPGSSAVIGPGARRFEFSFAALSFRSPSKVEVRYRLEGLDPDWAEAGARRSAMYTGLPPGDFAFRVIAANSDGVWNLTGARFFLTIRPHWYQRPAFFLLLALALTLGPWGIYRWRLRSIQRRSAHLERLLAEQRRLEGERGRLIGELESRNEQLENLTHAVSHDLKSPLFTIQGFLGALEKDLAASDRPRVDRDLARIREAASYMGRLLEQLSKVRRLESSAARLERIDFGELAGEVLAAVSGRIRDRGVEVVVEPRMPAVLGDRLQLTEMLQNLIDNATRFMGEQPRPRIEIGCRRDAEPPVFYVRDNGIGIAPRYQEKVFGLFQRLDHRHDGTGVGLAIVRRVVEAHRGRVWIESEGPGTGATFCFTLAAGPAT